MAQEESRIRFEDSPGISRVRTRSTVHNDPEGSVGEKEVGSFFEDNPHGVEERDFKKKQIFHGWQLWWLAYQSTGVIYGDIGTSPLYVYSSTFTSNPSYDDLVGALSLIIWSITLIVTIKYILIVLCADDEGEGGTFALYSLLGRYCNISSRDPRSQATVKIQRYGSTDLKPSNKTIRNWLENSKISHALLQILALLGVAMIISDGVLTPAQSVLGAIQGLEVVAPSISKSTIVGVTCAILVVLFAVQPLGISRIASAWAPIVIIWLGFNFGFGIYNCVKFDASVFKAFSPYFAGQFFVRNGTEGWKMLGGILLAFTGVEALFADLGAFSKRAIQMSWLGYCYPCLLMAYIGQAAYISSNPSAYSNPFFNSVPPGMFWPSLVIAILAAVVASQALITSSFQLLSQVMNASYFPQIPMRYTSERFHGQVYIPLANWLLMIGTVVVTAAYSNTTKLGEAYGVCVIFVTFITTNMVSLVALIVWRFHPLLVLAIWLPFAILDGLFLSSALTKVPDGAWFTIMLAIILSLIFILWRFGKEQQWKAEGLNRISISSLVQPQASGEAPHLHARYGGGELTTMKGIGVFFDKNGTHVPHVCEHFLEKFEAMPAIPVFFHMRLLAVPHVAPEQRYSVQPTGLPNCYRVLVRHGYNDHIISPDLGALIYNELRRFIIASAALPQPVGGNAEKKTHPAADTVVAHEVESSDTSASATAIEARNPSPTVNASVQARLAALDRAYNAQVVYLVGKEELRVLQSHNILRRALLGLFLFVRDNTRAKVAKLRVPVEKLVEVGFVKDM